MALVNSIIFVRFIAARMQQDANGKPFLSVSVAFSSDLADRFPHNSLVSWTLEGSDAMETFTNGVIARLRKDKSPLMVKFADGAPYKEAKGKLVKDPRKVVEGDGVLLLGVKLSSEPVAKAPKRGYHRHSIALQGALESVRVEPKARPNEINL